MRLFAAVVTIAGLVWLMVGCGVAVAPMASAAASAVVLVDTVSGEPYGLSVADGALQLSGMGGVGTAGSRLALGDTALGDTALIDGATGKRYLLGVENGALELAPGASSAEGISEIGLADTATAKTYELAVAHGALTLSARGAMIRRMVLAMLAAMVLMLPAGAQTAAVQTRTLVAYAGTYSANTVYSLNDMVQVGSEFYLSLTANNVGNTPGVNAAEWALMGSGSGSVGTAGATGPAGSQGPQGPAGATGAMGPVGALGLQGAAGAMGPAGPMGAIGPMGMQGVPGAIGATGPAGAAGPEGPAGTGAATGVVAETRTLSVAHLKGYNIMGGGSLTLFSATGAGNVERIQLAASYNSGSPALTPSAANTVITIAVDGVTYSCSLGMFLLWNGYTTSDGAPATNNLFVTKYLGITSGTSLSNETISGYRRVYIKYSSSISITIAVPPGPNIVWWSQVEYYPGVAPVGRFPATRNVFHMAVNEWSGIAPGQTVAVLPGVTGAGELESIYFVSSAPGPVEPQWLEQNPHIAVDGTDFWYGGTEDFFGNQFYGDQWQGRADEYGIARYFSSGAPDNTTYWTGYRYFRESAMVFGSSLGMTWQNAGGGAGPAAKVGTLAVYYTTQ